MKSAGKRLGLRLTALFRLKVSTWYNSARSLSIITFWLRIRYIRRSITSTGTRPPAVLGCRFMLSCLIPLQRTLNSTARNATDETRLASSQERRRASAGPGGPGNTGRPGACRGAALIAKRSPLAPLRPSAEQQTAMDSQSTELVLGSVKNIFRSCTLAGECGVHSSRSIVRPMVVSRRQDLQNTKPPPDHKPTAP